MFVRQLSNVDFVSKGLNKTTYSPEPAEYRLTPNERLLLSVLLQKERMIV